MEISFSFNMVIELVKCLHRYSNNEHFIKSIKDFKYKTDDYVEKIIKDIEENISAHLKNEIKYVFTTPNAMFLDDLIIKNNFTSYKELIKCLKTIKYKQYIDKVLEVVQLDSIEELEKASKEESELGFEKVLEMINNFDETIERIIYIIEKFYKNFFCKIENEIKEVLVKKILEHEKFYEEEPDIFSKTIIALDNKSFKDIKEVKSFVSFFAEFCISLEYLSNDTLYLIYGYQFEQKFSKDIIFEKSKQLFKTLGDDKRIEIIKLLSQREWYGNELAKELKITTATLSYHISRLYDIGIITFNEGKNKRFYYKVDKEQLRKLIQIALDDLL